MIGTTLGYDGIGSIVLFVIGDQPPERDEWKAYVDFVKERAKLHDKIRLVVLAGSGAPDAVQRKQLNDAVTMKQLRTAVVSDSIVARGVVTAFRWYGLELDAFKGSAMGDAFQYVAATPEEVDWLQRTVRAIRADLSRPHASAR